MKDCVRSQLFYVAEVMGGTKSKDSWFISLWEAICPVLDTTTSCFWHDLLQRGCQVRTTRYGTASQELWWWNRAQLVWTFSLLWKKLISLSLLPNPKSRKYWTLYGKELNSAGSEGLVGRHFGLLLNLFRFIDGVLIYRRGKLSKRNERSCVVAKYTYTTWMLLKPSRASQSSSTRNQLTGSIASQ